MTSIAWFGADFIHIDADLQSHPFTILSYDAPSELSSRASSQEELKDEKALSSDRLPASAGASHERRLKMIVRPQKGITSTLAKLCDQHKEPVVLVEGPYGNPFNLPLMCYDNVRPLCSLFLLFRTSSCSNTMHLQATFVSGGIGFTGPFHPALPKCFSEGRAHFKPASQPCSLM